MAPEKLHLPDGTTVEIMEADAPRKTVPAFEPINLDSEDRAKQMPDNLAGKHAGSIALVARRAAGYRRIWPAYHHCAARRRAGYGVVARRR